MKHKRLENGTEIWYINDHKHTGNEAIQFRNGNTYWLCNGTIHREGAPAITWLDGREEWYYNGKLHNDEGPAIIVQKEALVWALNGTYYFYKEWIKEVNLPKEKLVELKLRYG